MKNDEKIIAEKLIGNEPILKKELSSKTDIELIKCLNWYSYMSDEKDTDKWITDYMKNNNYDKTQINHVISTTYDSIKQTTAALCRMSNNGTLFIGELTNIISSRINKTFNNIIKIKKEIKSTENVISIQDRIKIIAQTHMSDLEEIFDSWYKNKDSKIIFSMYDFLQKEQLNTHVCNHIRFLIKRSYFDEFEEMLREEDECLNEGYAYLSKSKKKQIYNAFKECLSDIDRYTGNIKTIKPRKIRKKKPVSIEKQINNLNYQKEFNKLKIKSIDPQLIIGAQQLWVFNTKLNQLTVYNALSTSGFSIKGTTIQNYDQDTSIKKKVRKPNETLSRVLDGGKIVLKKIMSELTTKPIEVNGRINNDVIILRSIK